MTAGITRKTILLAGAAALAVLCGGAGISLAQDDHAGHSHAPVQTIEIKPGDPVVAVVNGTDIKRSDVQSFIDNQVPAQMKQQLPPQNLFRMAQDQVIANRMVDVRAAKAGIESRPEVVKQIAQAKEQVIRNAYVEGEIQKAMTEQKLQDAYKKAVGDSTEETRARHILVDTESKAKEIIKKLDAGGNFEDLAKENSSDPGSGSSGGDLGYFTKDQMVPEFSEAAFKLKPGSYTKAPVKSQFGWHIIKVEDRRKKEPPKFEDMKPQLEQQMRNEIIMDMLNKWQAEAKVKKFNINGDPLPADAK